MTTERIYSGTIRVGSYGEDDFALWLEPGADPRDEPLAGQIADDIEELGNTVTVSYWIAVVPRTVEQLLENEAKKLAGAADRRLLPALLGRHRLPVDRRGATDRRP